MRKLLLLAFSLALAACGGDDDEGSSQTFGASEMRAALEGTWTGPLTVDDKPTEATVALQYQAPGAKITCGTRTLGQGADRGVDPGLRCVDITTMGLVGTLTTADQRFSGSLGGDYSVMGNDPAQGELSLKGDPLTFSLNRAKDGSLKGMVQRDGAVVGQITLQRGGG